MKAPDSPLLFVLAVSISWLAASCGQDTGEPQNLPPGCGEGTALEDGECVAEAPAPADAGVRVRCGDGTVLQEGECVPVAGDAEGRTCGLGTVEVEGECVPEGAACVGDEGCPRGLFCVRNNCRERVCEPADRRCSGDDLETCDKDGLGWDLRRTCERGCEEGNCRALVCPALAVRCDQAGQGLEQCDALGLGWLGQGACPNGCAAGECRGPRAPQVCDDGQRRCEGDSVLACSDDRLGWVFDEACGTTCVAGACAPRACNPGQRQCNGPDLEQCDRRGLGFDYVRTCEGGCQAGACLPGGDGGGCPPGARRCVGHSVELCGDGGSWALLEVCDAECEGDHCRAPICQPGSRRCAGEEVEICSDNGLEWVFRRACETDCDRGECLAPVCERFARQCNGLVPEQCNPRGTDWVRGAPCQSTCHEGICDALPPGGCRPGSERCVELSRQICNDFFSWEAAEQCEEACIAGECTECLPGARQCRGDSVEACADDGSAWIAEDPCEVGCLQGRCTVCEPGERSCNGDTIEVCEGDGQGRLAASVCLTACDNGACTACRPGDLRCNGRNVERCVPEGIGWELRAECGGRCEAGVCAGEPICEPGTRRCVGQDVQVCTQDASAWLVVESCMQTCGAGSCEGPACLPFSLQASPAPVPADGTSSTLVVSGLILDVRGQTVPDGTLFTLDVAGARALTADGDPNTEGIQVRSLNGRIDFGVGAPDAPVVASIEAVHPVAGRCRGAHQFRFEGNGPRSVALDFTDDALNDAELTTALWDTILGRIDPFPSDFGGGEDGELNVGGNYNLNRDSQPGRLFPDAVNFQVTALGESSATVHGGVGGVDIGDEVLLINLQGTVEANDNVGNWGLQEIARIDYGANTIYFTTALRSIFGATDSNEDLAGQRIMLQRVPHYTDVTVTGTLTADGWDGTRGGVLFFKALGSTEVRGEIHMDGRGYRQQWGRAGESIGGVGGADRGRNLGGGGCGRLDTCWAQPQGCRCEWQWHALNGGGGAHASAGADGDQATGGEPYGTPDLARWQLGSAGGGRGEVRGYCDCNSMWEDHRGTTGSNGGGIVVIWSGGLSVRGRISAGQGDTGLQRGAAGSVFLRARSMNVGADLVRARGGQGGSEGRIRLDFFGLAGTTDPDYHPGFAGDTRGVTGSLDATLDPVTTATIVSAVTDERGGTLSFELSNDGGETWLPATPGEAVRFEQAESDLRLRVSFANENLDPLTLNGIVLRFE